MPGIMETAALAAAGRRPRTRQSISNISDLSGAGLEDKENVTLDLSNLASLHNASLRAQKQMKKSRSKSIGPGGLEALKETTGNRRKVGDPSIGAAQEISAVFVADNLCSEQSSIAFIPKSILKPTLPLSPLKAIPLKGFGTAVLPTSQKRPIPTRMHTAPEEPLINLGGSDAAGSTDPEQITIDLFGLNQKISELTHPAGSSTSQSIALKSEQEQQQEVKEREERDRLEKDIKERRDARRKSLANRRVSFAPEATLHTWDTREVPQDSTTSSTSPNSTRRGSSASTPSFASPYPPHNDSDHRGSDGSEPPSTPPAAPEDEQSASPAHQRDLHRKQHRRASELPLLTFPEPLADDLGDSEMSSPFSGSSAVGDDEDQTLNTIANTGFRSPRQTLIDGILEDIVADDDDQEETMMSNVSESSARLQSALREAAQQSGKTDEDGDATMELTQESMVIFKPWVRPGQALPEVTGAFEPEQKEIPIDPSLLDHTIQSQPSTPGSKSGADEDMSFTQALGFISTKPHKEATASPQRNRKSILGRRRSLRQSMAPSIFADETMDFTSASLGGIQSQSPGTGSDGKSSSGNEDDGVTMDLTMAVAGGIIQSGIRNAQQAEEQDDDTQMDMTVAIGGIQGMNTGIATEEPEQTMDIDMDVTMPIGRILRPTSENIITASRGSTPQKGQPTTPVKAAQNGPFFRQFSSKRTTPSKLFTRQSPNGPLVPRVILTPRSTRRSSGIGADKARLGSPRVSAILDRRSSLGQDGPEFRVGQSPLGRGNVVRFDDPRHMEDDVDGEREDLERRESGRFQLEQEADGRMNGTSLTGNLKDMIQSLSPQKSKPKGRKSLAVGTGRGLLGKRPAELDSDAEEEDSFMETSKRLKMDQSSPVKQIRLGKPPSVAQMIGRHGRSPIKNIRLSLAPPLERTITPSMPDEVPMTKSTPRAESRFKEVTAHVSEMPPLESEHVPVEEEELEPAPQEDRIHLQDFLNMTSIRFMELSTTKRRQTEAPPSHLTSSSSDPSAATPQDPSQQLQAAVVAGATTIPLLELYQHSCRELKKYIAEGRGIVREIEADTLAENPALFGEYVAAGPDVRFNMDRQFENVKTYARLQSRQMWYEWRSKLLESLTEGLGKIGRELVADRESLAEQERVLLPVLEPLVEQARCLAEECEGLRARVEELGGCDQGLLESTRQELVAVSSEVEAKNALLEKLKLQSEETERETAELKQKKEAWLADIANANRVRQQCRGYSMAEVRQLQSRVDALKRAHGWQVLSAQTTRLTMLYNEELQLSFDPAALKAGTHSADAFSASLHQSDLEEAQSLSRQPAPAPAQTFLLGAITRYLASLTRQESKPLAPKVLLQQVAAIWTRLPQLEALSASAAVRYRTITYAAPAAVAFTQSPVASRGEGEEAEALELSVTSEVVLGGLQSKIRVRLAVMAEVDMDADDDDEGAERDQAVRFRWKGTGRVVYGEKFREEVVDKFLENGLGALGGEMPLGGDGLGWAAVLKELEAKLVASRPNGRTS